jgi:pantetheine-phosphate adenylyltransferase
MGGHIAVYPGSFDPITFGHLDVVARGRKLFDELIVAVGRNPGKDPLFTADERLEMTRSLVQELVEKDPKGSKTAVQAFSGLTVDFEVQQAVTNREVAGLETVFVVAGQSFAYTSSSLIRQIAAMGDDLESALRPMCPPLVIAKLREKKKQRHPGLTRLLDAREEG